MIEFYDDSGSRKASIKEKKTICESPYNELLRIGLWATAHPLVLVRLHA